MFQLNKQSQLLTVSADVKLADLKSQLADEGFYFGYYPLEEFHHSIRHYLKRRYVNLYYFKYGSLPDLVSSCICELSNGKTFHLKDAPRAAIGPDFNRMVLGSKDHFGAIKTITLKICPLPEKILHGIFLVRSRNEAKLFVRNMVGNFILPLYFRFLNLDTSIEVLEDLKIKSKPCEILLICLSGLNEMVLAQQEVLEDYCETKNINHNWIYKKQERKIITQILHNPESYKDIKEQYRNFLWPASENAAQTLLEKDFLKAFNT